MCIRDSTATIPVIRPTLLPTTLSLRFDLANNEIYGAATNGVGTNSQIIASTLSASKPTPPVHPINNTFALVESTENGPHRVATFIVQVDAKGNVRIYGVFTNHRQFTQSTVLSSSGFVPIYISLPNNEILTGWLDPSGALQSGDGALYWFNPAGSTALQVAPL